MSTINAESNAGTRKARGNPSSRSLLAEGQRKVNWANGVQDYKTGLVLLKQAAALGQMTAHEWLGAMYDYGLGVRKNGRLAFKHYRTAATAGHPNAEYHVGVFYLEGVGVRQDYHTAVNWLRRD